MRAHRRPVARGVRDGLRRRAPAGPRGGGRDSARVARSCFVLSTSVKQPIGGLAISNGLRPGSRDGREDPGRRARTARHPGQRPAAGSGRHRAGPRARRDERRPGGYPRGGHVASIPLRRYGQPEEFGRVAAFLLSPASDYLTGAMLPVDGGLTRGAVTRRAREPAASSMRRPLAVLVPARSSRRRPAPAARRTTTGGRRRTTGRLPRSGSSAQHRARLDRRLLLAQVDEALVDVVGEGRRRSRCDEIARTGPSCGSIPSPVASTQPSR